MESKLTAIETTGIIGADQRLHLDTDLPVVGPMRVRVIVLCPIDQDDDETVWLQAAAHNPAFAFLKEAAEDLYSPTDGEPFHDRQYLR